MLHQRCELVAFRAHIFSCAATIFCLWTLRIATQQLKARGLSTLLHSVRLYYAIPCDAILFDVVLYYTMLLTTCRCMVAIVQTRLCATLCWHMRYDAIRCYIIPCYAILNTVLHSNLRLAVSSQLRIAAAHGTRPGHSIGTWIQVDVLSLASQSKRAPVSF